MEEKQAPKASGRSEDSSCPFPETFAVSRASCFARTHVDGSPCSPGYPPDHINAVLTHTLHFLSLLSFYLGIKLPFDVVWSRSTTPPSSGADFGQLGVGIPWIGASRGGESGGWARYAYCFQYVRGIIIETVLRWSTKYPLHVSSSAPPAPSNTTPTPSSSRPTGHIRSLSTPAGASSSAEALAASNLADSQLEEAPASAAPGSAFTTALAMLLYDVCYLAHTQAIEVPLAHAGEVLGNLWAVCCSPELGRCVYQHCALQLLPRTCESLTCWHLQEVPRDVATAAAAHSAELSAGLCAAPPGDRGESNTEPCEGYEREGGEEGGADHRGRGRMGPNRRSSGVTQSFAVACFLWSGVYYVGSDWICRRRRHVYHNQSTLR